MSLVDRNPAAVTSTSCSSSSSTSSGHHRTVQASKIPGSVTFSSSTKSSQKKKHPSLNHLFPLANINSNNNNNNSINNNDFVSYAIEQKRASRVPIQIIEQDFGVIDNQSESLSAYHRIQRPRTHYSVSKNENSAFHVVDRVTCHPQQQQYMALLKMLKSQEIQVEKQEKELVEKQREIEYREKAAQQLQLEHEQHVYSQQLDQEVEYHKQLNGNYDHLQKQIKHCSTDLEKKNLLQEQIQTNIDRLHREIEDLQSRNHTTIRDMRQYEQDLERCNFTVHQQEDLFYILANRNNDIERLIEQRRNYIDRLENELVQLDDLLLKNITHPTNQCGSSVSIPAHYHSCLSSNGTTATIDPSAPIRLQFVNSTVWKLCPSGIWV